MFTTVPISSTMPVNMPNAVFALAAVVVATSAVAEDRSDDGANPWVVVANDNAVNSSDANAGRV